MFFCMYVNQTSHTSFSTSYEQQSSFAASSYQMNEQMQNKLYFKFPYMLLRTVVDLEPKSSRDQS
jgi:hypothetical protein